MVKRDKRLGKSVESLKRQIDLHFTKLENDINEKNDILARYHIKEIEKNLLDSLEYRMNLLGKIDKALLEKYRKRLKEIEDKLL
jgi:hypothetical protein